MFSCGFQVLIKGIKRIYNLGAGGVKGKLKAMLSFVLFVFRAKFEQKSLFNCLLVIYNVYSILVYCTVCFEAHISFTFRS